MTRHPMRAAVLTAMLSLVLAPTAASPAASGEGSDFGHHVSQCARDIGFDGMHNPGMHQGFSGVPTHHECAPMP